LLKGSYTGSNQPAGIINKQAQYGVLYWPDSWYANSGGTGVDVYDSWTPAMDNKSFGNIINISIPDCTPKGGMTVAQAYNIDLKLDDGKPGTGKIVQFDPWTGGGNCIIWEGSVTSLTLATSEYLLTDTTPNRASIIYANAIK